MTGSFSTFNITNKQFPKETAVTLKQPEVGLTEVRGTGSEP